MPAVKKATSNTNEASAEEQIKSFVNEQKFNRDKLRSNSMKLFGVTQSTFDGAMHGHKEKEFTLKEAKAIINVWLYGKEGKK